MSEQDMPWNDVPADDDAPLGAIEPDPAEVLQDEDGEPTRDLEATREHDPYRRDTLDERLSEEEPEAPRGVRGEAAGVQVIDPGGAGGDAELGEPDDEFAPGQEPAAEDAAVHIVDEDEVL